MGHSNLPSPFYGGLVSWRLVLLHWCAYALGLHVHVEGFPYGTLRNVELGMRETAAGSGAEVIR